MTNPRLKLYNCEGRGVLRVEYMTRLTNISSVMATNEVLRDASRSSRGAKEKTQKKAKKIEKKSEKNEKKNKKKIENKCKVSLLKKRHELRVIITNFSCVLLFEVVGCV